MPVKVKGKLMMEDDDYLSIKRVKKGVTIKLQLSIRISAWEQVL